MNQALINTTIHIFGKDYQVKCRETEVYSLQQSALFLEEKLKESCKQTQSINAEKILVMTALNLAHQFLSVERQQSQAQQILHQRIHDLQSKVESALVHQTQLELNSLGE